MKVKRERELPDESELPPKKPRKEPSHYPKTPAPPIIPSGEDMTSHQRHTKMLQMEERKRMPNKGVVADLMTRTYPFRRQEVLDFMVMKDIIKTYPPLRKCDQV